MSNGCTYQTFSTSLDGGGVTRMVGAVTQGHANPCAIHEAMDFQLHR